MLVADYDSDEEDTMAKRLAEEAAAEKAKADAALAAAASSDSDSDSEEDDSDDSDQEGAASKGGGAAKPQEPATKLPSALELLETVEAPSFLSVPAHQPEFDVQPMQAPVRQPRPHHDRKRGREGDGQGQGQAYKKGAAERPPAAQHQEAAMPPPPPSRRQQQQQEQEEKEAARRKKEKLDAKERVKNQRMRGQSGIGEDFKSWKTEEEMRMRQHYD